MGRVFPCLELLMIILCKFQSVIILNALRDQSCSFITLSPYIDLSPFLLFHTHNHAHTHTLCPPPLSLSFLLLFSSSSSFVLFLSLSLSLGDIVRQNSHTLSAGLRVVLCLHSKTRGCTVPQFHWQNSQLPHQISERHWVL